MKFTLSWLKEHLDTAASLDEISAKLTAIGLEVENIANPAAGLEDFVIAAVTAAIQWMPAAKRCKSFAARPMPARA
jgi:phenylalanyl-tRNA synthetase beta chain